MLQVIVNTCQSLLGFDLISKCPIEKIVILHQDLAITSGLFLILPCPLKYQVQLLAWNPVLQNMELMKSEMSV